MHSVWSVISGRVSSALPCTPDITGECFSVGSLLLSVLLGSPGRNEISFHGDNLLGNRIVLRRGRCRYARFCVASHRSWPALLILINQLPVGMTRWPEKRAQIMRSQRSLKCSAASCSPSCVLAVWAGFGTLVEKWKILTGYFWICSKMN